MKEFDEIFELEGSGKNKKEAVVNAIAKVRDCVIKKYTEEIILHIKPLDVQVVSVGTESKQESKMKIKKFKDKCYAVINIKAQICMVLLD